MPPSPVRPSCQISDALESYASRLANARERANEDAELAMAMARSVAETRVDRYALEQESRYRSDTMRTHDYMEGVSGDRDHDHAAEGGQHQGQGYEEAGSRAPYDSQAAFFGQQQQQQQSPQPLHESAPTSSASPYDGLEALAGLTFDPPAAQSNAAADDPFASAAAQYNISRAPSLNPFAPTNPYASLTASSPARGGGGGGGSSSYEPDSILEGQEASHTTPIRPVGSPVDEHGVRERSTTDSSIKSSFIPEAPSAKALGKLRRVSVGQSELLSPRRQYRLFLLPYSQD